jgi:hypothetical protein
MGCGAAEPSYSATPAASAPAVQGQ